MLAVGLSRAAGYTGLEVFSLHQFCSSLGSARPIASSLSYEQRNFSSGMGTAGMGPHSLIKAEAGFKPWALPSVLCVLHHAASRRGPRGVANSLGRTDRNTVDTEPHRASLPTSSLETPVPVVLFAVSKLRVPGPVPGWGHRGATCRQARQASTLA